VFQGASEMKSPLNADRPRVPFVTGVAETDRNSSRSPSAAAIVAIAR
jgi:hypothetical protein